MTSRQIDYILTLAETKNFGRAAEALFTSQPTLSYQIKSVEAELGFRLFDRSGRGAFLTPAGEQFCVTLRHVREELKLAIEQGQNFSARYREALTLGLPFRSCLPALPAVIRDFEAAHPGVSIVPHFLPLSESASFLKGEEDILFAMETDVRHIPDITLHPLYKSPICLIMEPGDPLAKLSLVRPEDLRGRTLMVGGGSPPELRRVQKRVVEGEGLSYFNSHDHPTTLTNVAAKKGVCLAPLFLREGNDGFAWTPFACEETVPCVLCTHTGESRPLVKALVQELQALFPNGRFKL